MGANAADAVVSVDLRQATLSQSPPPPSLSSVRMAYFLPACRLIGAAVVCGDPDSGSRKPLQQAGSLTIGVSVAGLGIVSFALR